ncbi:MAG: DPP IV N-terminal domain-containing protein [Deltaproteobacteria bacterium]|nr:DPP IV N-terminal domain-containing protein [Deltaproteobacteria bacterium]
MVLGVTACGAEPPRPTAQPSPVKTERQPYEVGVDPAVTRIFSDPPPTGQLPSSMTWSPDGQVVAYLRTSRSPEGKTASELWLHEMKGHRERPLVADAALSVDSYSWAGSARLVFAALGDLHVVDLAGSVKRLTETAAKEDAPQASPDGAKVAFVREHDLFVRDLGTGKETRVTEGGSEDRTHGEVTWLYGEEFDVKVGFGWSPDGRRLWLYETDESKVTRSAIVTDPEGGIRRQAYPRPGEPNPVVRVGVAELGDGGVRLAWLDTSSDADTYVPRVAWHPDSKRLLVTRMDRLQTVLELLACETGKGTCAQVLEERDPRFLNLLGAPRFVGAGEELLWLSESDGFAHIYRIGMDGSRRGRLTTGRWVVTSIDAVDDKAGAVFFTANKDATSEYRLYRVPLAGGDPEPVSIEPGTHEVLFSPDGASYVDTRSSLVEPPRAEIHEAKGAAVALVDSTDLGSYFAPQTVTDIFPIDGANNETLEAMLTRPEALDPSVRYPVLVYVYGGPRSQVVKNAFRPKLQPWRNLLASRGILVWSVDGRGSCGRGREFETAIHRNLGQLELEDQLAGVKYLKAQPYTDPDRLAIFGWSYGGTMVLNALLKAPGVFRAGVAVAPVTDWRQYDSAYTERYMQRPEDNPEGYAAASVLGSVDKLDVPLLLVHGLSDDNVHFVNSAKLVDALIEERKTFDVMFYPGKSHSIDGGNARIDLFSRITRFVEQHI